MTTMQTRPYVSLRDAMDRLFESAFTPSSAWATQWSRGMASWPVNVYENDESYRVCALVPGADPEQLEVTAQPNNRLTITGQIRPNLPEGTRVIWQEFGEMQFRRDVQLSLPFDADRAEVSYHDGVLEVVLPKKEEARPRQIRVLANGKGNGRANGAHK